MSFNPLKMFGDKSKTVAPPRGAGGKFVSLKKKEPEERDNEEAKGPFPLTFYGHEIRRYHKGNRWYFSVDDIAKTAYLNAEDPSVRKGDPEKLADAKKEYETQINGVAVAKPKDIAKFIPFFKGNMPGPIVDWLISNSELPVPEA